MRPTMSFFFIIGSRPTVDLDVAISTCRGLRRMPKSNTCLVRLGQSNFYLRNLFQRCLRLRIERFLFKQSYLRAYVYFKNVMSLTLFKFQF